MKELREMVDSTAYFKDEFVRDHHSDSSLEWPSHRVHLLSGSSSQDVLSLNLLGVELDELNFHRKGGSGKIGDIAKAHNDYIQTTNRRRSRFVNNGVDHGFSILISSATMDTSFTNKRIKDGRSNKQENQHVTYVKMWEAKAGIETYSDRKFAVFCGNDTVDPMMIEEPLGFLDLSPNDNDLTEVINKAISKPNISLQEIVNVLPSDFRERMAIIPWDFKADFDADLIISIQNIAGLSTGDAGKFFTSRLLWMKSCYPDLRHPFNSEAITITLFTSPVVADFFIPENLFNMETMRFLRHPDTPRYVHIDQSTSKDFTGIGMVHLNSMQEGDFGIIRPVIEMDFALRIQNTKPPDKISIAKILSFFFWLKSMFHIQYGRISYDRYASNLSLQELEINFIPSGLTSVDRDDIPWVMFRQLLDSGRFMQYETEEFRHEIFHLIHDRLNRKVDHTSTSTKDISDGVIGATFDCLNDIDRRKGITPENIRDNIIMLGASRRGSGKRVISDRSDWIFSDYEKTMGAKVTSIGNADELREREQADNKSM
jgi:hypothetical protein